MMFSKEVTMTPRDAWKTWPLLLLVAACSPTAKMEEELTAVQAGTAALGRQIAMKDTEIAQYEQSIARLKGEIDLLLEKQTALESQVEVLRLKDDAAAALDALRIRADACEARLSAAGERVDDLEKEQRQARLIQSPAGGEASRASRTPPRSRTEPQDRYVFAREPGSRSSATAASLSRARCTTPTTSRSRVSCRSS